MNKIDFGARQAVVNCLGVRAGERVVVITDHETEKLADAVYKQAETVGARLQKFIMEDFGPRPADGRNALPFPDPIDRAMSRAQVSIFIASARMGEFKSFRKPMTQAVRKYKLRHAHMPGFIEEMMSQGMAVDYAKVQKLCRKVHGIVSRARQIRVTTPAGSDFVAGFSPKIHWVICDGILRKPGHWSNLPDGEVYTTPVAADGRVVIDGCFCDIFSKKYGKLAKTPLSYDLKGNRCVRGSVRCKNRELKREFEKLTFKSDANSDRLGEFAIGTNLAITKLIGNMLQDEKIPAVHLALGDPISAKTGAGWSSSVHNDGLMLKPTVAADGKVIMKAGKFLV